MGGVESWLWNIKDAITDTLSDIQMKMLDDIMAGTPCDELALKVKRQTISRGRVVVHVLNNMLFNLQYPNQLCCVGILFIWTRECEAGINELKYDRKALSNTSKKFGVLTNKISSTISRGNWRSNDEPMTIIHKKRLENMSTVRFRECFHCFVY